MIRLLSKKEPIPIDLLLLADESKIAIDKYIFQSSIFVFEENKQIIGVCTVVETSIHESEIKTLQ